MHITREEAECFRDGNLGWFQRLRVRRHLRRCAACRAFLAGAEAGDAFLAEFGRSIREFEALEQTIKRASVAQRGGRHE